MCTRRRRHSIGWLTSSSKSTSKANAQNLVDLRSNQHTSAPTSAYPSRTISATQLKARKAAASPVSKKTSAIHDQTLNLPHDFLPSAHGMSKGAEEDRAEDTAPQPANDVEAVDPVGKINDMEGSMRGDEDEGQTVTSSQYRLAANASKNIAAAAPADSEPSSHNDFKSAAIATIEQPRSIAKMPLHPQRPATTPQGEPGPAARATQWLPEAIAMQHTASGLSPDVTQTVTNPVFKHDVALKATELRADCDCGKCVVKPEDDDYTAQVR